MKNVCTVAPFTFVLFFFVLHEQVFTMFLVTIRAVFPGDKGVDMCGDAFFDIMKVVWENLFVAVDTHSGEL
jgi:hypothetical protein